MSPQHVVRQGHCQVFSAGQAIQIASLTFEQRVQVERKCGERAVGVQSRTQVGQVRLLSDHGARGILDGEKRQLASQNHVLRLDDERQNRVDFGERWDWFQQVWC